MPAKDATNEVSSRGPKSRCCRLDIRYSPRHGRRLRSCDCCTLGSRILIVPPASSECRAPRRAAGGPVVFPSQSSTNPVPFLPTAASLRDDGDYSDPPQRRGRRFSQEKVGSTFLTLAECGLTHAAQGPAAKHRSLSTDFFPAGRDDFPGHRGGRAFGRTWVPAEKR